MTMLGFSSMRSSQTSLIMQCTKNGMTKDCSGDLLAAFDRMRSAHQHLRLDDRNEILALTGRRLPRQRVCIGLQRRQVASRLRRP